jgi:cytochrome b561
MRRYTNTAILLHWSVAILIIANFILGLTMVDIPGLTPTKLRYFSWHKWVGITLFGLASIRILWRLRHPAPPHPANMLGWQRLTASGVHAALYLLLFAIPLSGYFYSLAAGVPVMYLGFIPMPIFMDANPYWKPILKQVHYWLNGTILLSFSLHLAGVLKHELIDRDSTLKRMMPSREIESTKGLK